ncbi:hypothetical protein SAMN05216338_1006199 [Bradyrhizobium sp. Rc2d]|uniref:DUF5681 domain-containing protein n=1 Tax=Bradyrhizobium sp. Rc2d TaxID=1855321 RepID=UPI00088F34FB|nr:DUF5681 domain-containing protein [Bradyrhizobium sp. Rc2d]SDH21454.1 hypothetical protein SAMN05216338_1006199 [Bradyrhizobium sp. Rc2d]
MAKTSFRGASAPGRVPPPANKRFAKGISGNPNGRPRGAVSLDAMTRKFALRRDNISIGGKRQRLSRLEIALQVLRAQAADAKPTAIRLVDELRSHVWAGQSERPAGGILLVPAPLSLEEYIAQEQERTKDAPMPGTAIDLQAEEFLKAVNGEPSEYGAALLAFHCKYHG